jgi:mRNA interferase RelE/StbE
VYDIQFKKSSGKELAKLPRKEQVEIAAILDGLRENPKPVGHKQLNRFNEHPPIFRVYCMCGQHRIIYTIKENLLLILILKVGLRATVYSDFAEMMRGVKPRP